MAFGVLSGSALRRVVRESAGVTLAMAAMTATGAVPAADSLEMSLVGGSVAAQAVADKVRTGPSWGLVLAGLSRVGNQRLLDVVAPAVEDASDLDSAALAAVTALGGVVGPHHDTLFQLFAHNEVVWELLLAAAGPDGRWRYLQLRSFRIREGFDLDVLRHEPAPGERSVVVLGSRHPQLQRYDEEYRRTLEASTLAARLQYHPLPEAALTLPSVGLAAAVRAAMTAAVATEHLAQRPEYWPADAPVAAGPVRCEVVGAVA